MSECTKVRVFGAKSFLIIFAVILTILWLASWLTQVIIIKKSLGAKSGEATARKIAQMFFSLQTPASNKYNELPGQPKMAGTVSLILCLGISIACGFAASAGGVPNGGPKGWACVPPTA